MIFHLIILTTTSLFSQVKCRTYVPEKDFVDYSLNPTYNLTEQRQIVFVDKGQYPNRWNENVMKDDRSPIIFTDKAPVTVNYIGVHSGPEQPPDRFRNFNPIVVTSQGNVTVNYDDSQDDEAPPSNQDICMLTNTCMVQLPSGIVMPYLKFKTISPYLLVEDLKSDIRVILDNKSMSYKQFQETLRYYDCGDIEDSSRSPEIGLTNHVTLANGTLKVEMDDYRNIVSSITSGSETVMVPNVVSGKYWLYRSLIADELPELIASAFVITHKGIVVPFSLYYTVDREHFQRPSTAAVVPKVRRIKWRDGKLVDVQTVRHVIDALRTPTMISFVFPNGKRMPFIRCSVKELSESYDYDPGKVLVDVGQCENVLLSHFNDILFAVHNPDDDCKCKRFNPPAVFAWDPNKCLNATSAQLPDGDVCKQSNEVDYRKYSGYSIRVINKEKARLEDKFADKILTVFDLVSAMEKTIGLESNDTIRMILTSSSGTHEIEITNVLDNKKPLMYDITNKTINVRDLIKNMSQNECDYSPVYLMNKTNIPNVTDPVNSQTNHNCTNILKAYIKCNCIQNILKNNEPNSMVDIKNKPTDDSKNTLYLNESTKNQTVTRCNENPSTNNNKNQTTDTVIIAKVTQNHTELMNTTTNPSTCRKMDNITTIETKNNATENPECKYTKNQQNSSSPVTEVNKMSIIKSNNNQTENKNTTVSPPNFTSKNTTNSNTTTLTINPNQTTMTSNHQNGFNPVSGYREVPTMNKNNENQTETKNTTSPNFAKNTSNLNITNTDEKYEPKNTSNNTVTTKTRNNTTSDKNSSSPVVEGNTIPITTVGNNNQTETMDTTTLRAPNITENTTGSNNTNADKIYEPNNTNNNTVTTEARNNNNTDPKNNQNSFNSVNESNAISITTVGNNNQTETNNTTTISAPNITANTTGWNDTNKDKKYELNNTSNDTVTMETKNNTNTDQNNYQNSSNPVVEDNTIPITTVGNINQTETMDTTTISSPNITENTTGSNNTNTDKIYEPNDTSNNTVTMETRNSTTTDPNHTAVVTENRQNGSNPVNGTNEIAAVSNTNYYQNPTETINTTVSTPNYTENTSVGSNVGRKDKDTYTGSNETPNVNNTAETIRTSDATRASEAADVVGSVKNPKTIPETNTVINDDTSDDAYNITTTGKTETNQPIPIYTETIKSPSNNSVTNNATNIINIIVY